MKWDEMRWIFSIAEEESTLRLLVFVGEGSEKGVHEWGWVILSHIFEFFFPEREGVRLLFFPMDVE